MNKNKLFSDFPSVSSEQWKEKIITDLKGADYQKKLVWKTREGFEVEPYYMMKDLEKLEYLNLYPGEFPFVRGKNIKSNNWIIQQNIFVENIEKANNTAIDILNKGVMSIGFVLKDKTIKSEQELAMLIKGIDLEATAVNFILANPEIELLTWFDSIITNSKFDKLKINASVNFDPLGYLSITGGFPDDNEDVYNKVNNAILFAKKRIPKTKVLCVNSFHFNNAGVSSVQELAIAISMGNEYLSELIKKGLTVDDISSHIQFNVGISTSYFMEIAKQRALRYLWAKIVEAYNPKKEESCEIFIHSETTLYNNTAYDPYVNVLRTTTEAMSAILGGTDSLSVHPFDISYKKPDKFSERIARNQQLILKEEANFDKVVDPAAGSYYVEHLTDSLIEKAWDLFLEIEQKGGYVKAFTQQFIQEQIKDTIEKRRQQISKSKENLLGTNHFPNFNEILKDDINTSYQLFSDYVLKSKKIAEAIKIKRGAEDFENMRLKTDNSGKRPKVFMFTYGDVTMRIARAQFASNFFGCAGFEPINNDGFTNINDGIKSALESKAEIVVICSSDNEYAEIVPKIYNKLKDKTIVVVAGAPACMDELKEKGIKHFIHVKSSLLEELKAFQQKLGIE